MAKSELNSYYQDLNLLYLQKAIDIERLFTRNVVYLSLTSIIISLLFIQHVLPNIGNSQQITAMCFLYASWIFYFLTICCAAALVFFSAAFKDVMFETTIKNIIEDQETLLYEGRTHWSGTVVYVSAAICAVLFLVGLALLLIFFGINISNLEA